MDQRDRREHTARSLAGLTRPVPVGRKVVVYGPSGAGKSTLAAALSQKLGVPHIELDAVFHARPNWDDLSIEEFREAVGQILVAHPDGWICDGNYSMLGDLLLSKAETAIWIQLPFRTVYARLVARTLRRAFRGTELWNGNRESLRQTFLTRDSMLWWGIKSWRTNRAKVYHMLTTMPHQARVYQLRTAGQVRYVIEHAVPESSD